MLLGWGQPALAQSAPAPVLPGTMVAAADQNFGAGAEPGGAAQLEVRVGRLEEQVRSLTGRAEELDYQLAQSRQRIDRLSSDLEFRLGQLEKTQAAGAGAVEPPPAAGGATTGGVAAGDPTAETGEPGDPNRSPPPRDLGSLTASDLKRLTGKGAGAPAPTDAAGSPKDQYDRAVQLIVASKYDDAEQSLKNFIAQNPKDPLVANAQYWLGETFYARQNYAEAAKQFFAGYQKYPQSPKAPDNLLKLGLSLESLGKKSDACSAFQHFSKEYPTASVTLKRRASEERQKLNCA